jgi:hypothetical protein
VGSAARRRRALFLKAISGQGSPGTPKTLYFNTVCASLPHILTPHKEQQNMVLLDNIH